MFKHLQSLTVIINILLVFRGGSKPTVRWLLLPQKLRQLGRRTLTELWVYLRPIVLLVTLNACASIAETPLSTSQGTIRWVTQTPTIASQPQATSTLTPTSTKQAVAMGNSTLNEASGTHTIEAGDTLLALAIEYNVDVEAILAANPSADPRLLQIGQVITLPLGSPKIAVTVTPRPTPMHPVTDIQGEVSTSQNANLASLAAEMLAAVNLERQTRDIHSLLFDSALAVVARAHAQDMANRGYFDHVTPEGVTLRDRLQAAGINKHWVGENIQANTRPADATVQEAMYWFMGSQPHRENILAAPYTRLGIGVAEGPVGWFTFVLVFAGES